MSPVLTADMAVRKLRASWWIDFVFRGRRYRLRAPSNNRSDAADYEHRLREQLSRGGEVSREALMRSATASPRLADFAERWLAEYVVGNLKPSTQRTYAKRLRSCIVPYLGAKRLEDIDVYAIERLKAHLACTLQPRTVNKTLSVLRKCLETAIEWGIPARSPRVKWLREPPRRFHFLSVAESDALLCAVQRDPWRLMVLCALRTGLRLGELIGLRWEDIDFERRQLSVRRSVSYGIESSPKNNRFRYVPLASDLFHELASKRREGGWVFLHRGSPVTSSSATNALRRACEQAGLRPLGWHVLRHTFASQLASDGHSLYKIQWLLGHSDPKMTQIYAHLAPSALHGAVERLVELRAAHTHGNPLSTNGEQVANTQQPPGRDCHILALSNEKPPLVAVVIDGAGSESRRPEELSQH